MENLNSDDMEYNNNNFYSKQSKKKENDDIQKIREIQIDSRFTSKQVKLNILGIEVYFPYQPYENQLLYMQKVIEALKKNSIAGLESPTGTGKTLCLLCASLAYLKYIREELKKESDNHSMNEENKKRQPVIFYTSRTHSQIANAIKELKKTVYRPINAVISSREQSCVNEFLNNFNGGLLNIKCKYAVKKGECKYFKGKSLQGKGWSAYDGLTVDELKEKGKKYKFCPYQYEKDKSQNSDIVFLPYNYIFDMRILKRTKLILANSILIVDEAHNLQDVCSDSVSVSINTNVIDDILNDLKALKTYLEEYETLKIGANASNSLINDDNIKPDYLKNEITILTILKERIMNLKLNNINASKGQNAGLKLTAEEFFNLLFKKYKGSQTTIQFFNVDNQTQGQNANQILLDNNDSDNEIKPELTPNNIIKHISFLKNVEYFINNDRGKGTLISTFIDFLEIINILCDDFSDKKDNKDPSSLCVNNFRFYVEEIKEQVQNNTNKKNKKISFQNKPSNTKRILHVYCFNPGFGFQMVMNHKFYSTIITSGTLSPIDSMESELKQNFEIKLENNHVISDEQFHFCLLTSSTFNNMEFNFKVDNRLNLEMIYQLGLTILELCKITPGGILVFFSSYSIMDKYVSEWRDKNIISEISKYKEFYQDRREQKENKVIINKYKLSNSDRTKYKGAILLSVCRGSCSEGMNFKDDMARLVIVIGIPYPMLYDPKVQLKKEFQDEYNKLLIKNSKIKKINGSEWYTQNAIKCVNQSLGRVIRHSNDYGSMLLIDTRYQNLIRRNYISQWIRKKCKIYNNPKLNESFLSDMKNFFINAENFVENKKLNSAKSKTSVNNNLKANSNKYSRTSLKKDSNSKNSKLIIEKMNETEKLNKSENDEDSSIIKANKSNICILKISKNEEEKKNKEAEDSKEQNFEGINNIDENYFDNLAETPDSKEFKSITNTKKELSDKELINELIKKKNNREFIEELEKNGMEIDNKDAKHSQKNVISCYVCYSSSNESKVKLEVGKCGHVLCQYCWSKIENEQGISKCPVCRKIINKTERNLIYI